MHNVLLDWLFRSQISLLSQTYELNGNKHQTTMADAELQVGTEALVADTETKDADSEPVQEEEDPEPSIEDFFSDGEVLFFLHHD